MKKYFDNEKEALAARDAKRQRGLSDTRVFKLKRTANGKQRWFVGSHLEWFSL